MRGIYDLPENTATDILVKIEAMASDIRSDWNEPKHRANTILRLSEKLRALNKMY